MKFAHLADTHIKNLKYHYEYREVFKQLYSKLHKEKVDYIIHCGDIAHTKTQLSPEFVDLCSKFLSGLASIAPTYIILGNHDGNLKNKSRQDAITPIVRALKDPDIHLLKNSGEVFLDGMGNDKDFSLNVLSVFDRDNWIGPSKPGHINIGLYHGAISNSQTDLGWTMEHGEDDMEIFKEFDYAFLGDIHKTNQVLDNKGKIRYAGSTVQQNHGETNDKGFLIWDIKDKDNFTCKHVVLENPRPFVTIELTKKGRINKKVAVPPKARLRLVSNNNLSLNIMKKAVEVAKHRFEPESITFLNRAAGTFINTNDDGSLAADNLRDPVVQKKAITDYLKDYDPEEEMMEAVLKLNSKYNVMIEDDEEVKRNVNWSLDYIEWDNLFNYGEGNKIDFNRLSGIVGIFGKNYSGKSSIIDSVLYTLFNSTSKNERKNLNIINQNKENCKGKVTISIGNKKFFVERTSEKYIKKLKGEETLEAKTDLNFEVYDEVTGKLESLNGITRNDTDKNIRKYFGTLEDFLLTSMTSQLGALAFIGEGSTRRKEILAKFLDLEMFEKKYKMAKEDASDFRGALKRLEGKEFDEDIFAAEKDIIFNEAHTRNHSENCETIKESLVGLQQKIDEIQKSIDSIPTEVIDIEKVTNQNSKKEKQAAETIADTINLQYELTEKEDLLKKINEFIDVFNIEELREKKETTIEKTALIGKISDKLCAIENSVIVKEKKKQLLEEVPCGDKYPNCKFICDAHNAGKELVDLLQEVKNLNYTAGELNNKIEDLNPDKIDEHLEKYNQLLGKKKNMDNEISTTKLLIEKNEIALKAIEKEIKELEQQKEVYYENKDIIENKGSFIRELDKINNRLSLKEQELEECQEALMEYYREHGSLEERVQALKDQKKELESLREEYAAYDLFMKCMHSNGIAYSIIKKKLPVINNEIAKVLANVVNFEVFLENEGRHLKILIKHPEYEPRPLVMGSGAEKTIAAMAIRLALLSVSSLPKSNIFILDEPGTALDAENMDGFVSILELVKSYFKTVLLISHLDSLKDCVDMQVTIEKKGKFAQVLET